MNIFQTLKIPDIVTLSNALFGITAMFAVHGGFIDLAFILLLLAAVADGADGYLARRHTGSELGESLDSLADVISFGAAPAVIVYFIYGADHPFLVGAVVCFYVICGILRLARFNALPKNTSDFEGLPITAGCVMLAAYLLMDDRYIHYFAVIALVVILSLLMVSTLPYCKLKNPKHIAVALVIVGLTISSFFIDVGYTHVFSSILFLSMVLYAASPVINIRAK